MNKSTAALLALLICFVVSFSACSPAPAAADPVTPRPTQQVSAEVLPTLPPTPEPTVAPTAIPPVPCMIAFESDRDGNREIYIMGPDGSHPNNLSNNPGDDSDPVWSPDGSRIAFVSNRENDPGGQFIYVMDAGGQNARQLSHQNNSISPDWSPEGSRIAFAHKGDIFLVNPDGGDEVNLTNSPEEDDQPKFSPDGQTIAWLMGPENNRQVYVMDVDGGKPRQVTSNGAVQDAEWTVDGRLFVHWENSGHSCFNCVVSADGAQVTDAGGKGTIQEFLPFWTLDGKRVEMISFPGPKGDDEIFLVGDEFPGMFLNLTNNPAVDRNPDAPFTCGPAAGSPAQDEAQSDDSQTPNPAEFVIGYVSANKPLDEQAKADLDQACGELGLQCMEGESIPALVDQKVSAILSFSNRWDVLGSAPAIRDAVGAGVPFFVLNAETDVPGAYNLAAEDETVRNELKWMFKLMGGSGEFVYYNFGRSDIHQKLIDQALKEFPGIKATAMPAEYEGNSLTQAGIAELVKANPRVGAIWSDEHQDQIFRGLMDLKDGRLPLTTCPPRKDVLTTWKNFVDEGGAFECIAYVKPGGTGYEGVYAAYYLLSGLKFKPEALTGQNGNTLKYDIPEITNKTLPDSLGWLEGYRLGKNQIYELPPMRPEEIRSKWFVEK